MAWRRVPKANAPEVKAEIKLALKIKSDPQFYRRMKGVPEPSVSEAEAITEIFNRQGITEVWQ